MNSADKAILRELGLFDMTTHLCHCSHTYSKALDAGEQSNPRSHNAWAFVYRIKTINLPFLHIDPY